MTKIDQYPVNNQQLDDKNQHGYRKFRQIVTRNKDIYFTKSKLHVQFIKSDV